MNYDLLLKSLDSAPSGLALEFGVGEGGSLRQIAARRPGRKVGFDWFEGLPEDWREGFPKGAFAAAVPSVPGAELVVGLFQDTLPNWFAEERDIALVHIDCDLYSSTATVLSHLPRLRPGVMIVFDELVGYPGWEAHEHRALLEWVASTGVVLDPAGSNWEQVSYRVSGYLS